MNTDDDSWCACDAYYTERKDGEFEICGYCENPIPKSTARKMNTEDDDTYPGMGILISMILGAIVWAIIIKLLK